MHKRKILFLTGTRADFGKMKPLIDGVREDPSFEYCIFVTGMHTMLRYGFTVDEVMKSYAPHRLNKGFRNVHVFMNQIHGESMDMILGNTVFGLSRYVSEYKPDLVVVHGDRVEAMAGAIVGALRNILVAHVEGGEKSGTIDELIRHAVSKMAHIHFVANEESRDRLIQMGECSDSIYVIGSPDVDLMLSDNLPSLAEVFNYYTIPFQRYAIALYHPVTTDLAKTRQGAKELVDAMLESQDEFVVIYPNNDSGSDFILEEYERLKGHPRFAIYPSLRISYFLTLLRNAKYIVGNSSAGVRETPVYGVRSVNIGFRQDNRAICESIINVDEDKESIIRAMKIAATLPKMHPELIFGKGDSATQFMKVLSGEKMWNISRQKKFIDIIHNSLMNNK